MEKAHKEFLLQLLRAASLRLKMQEADCTSIGLALKSDLIGTDTAVAWIRDSNLSWVVGAIPEEVGRVARANRTEASNVT